MINLGLAILIAWVSFIVGFILCALLTNSKIWDESPRVKS